MCAICKETRCCTSCCHWNRSCKRLRDKIDSGMKSTEESPMQLGSV
jgi:hypothetical protein